MSEFIGEMALEFVMALAIMGEHPFVFLVLGQILWINAKVPMLGMNDHFVIENLVGVGSIKSRNIFTFLR